MSRVLKLFALAFATVVGTAACTGKGTDAPSPQQQTSWRWTTRPGST